MPQAGQGMRELHQPRAPFRVAILGKTLILGSSLLNIRFGDPLAMYALLAQIVRFLPTPPAQNGVAGRLMESAGARAGHNPQQAQELRVAACAYLRVVR